jgi:hypothetical protein
MLRRRPTKRARASVTRASEYEIAVHWWIYRWCYLEGRRLDLEERTSATPGSARRSQALSKEVPPDDRPTFDQHVEGILKRITHRELEHNLTADPDDIERRAIAQAIAQAEDNGDGWGFAPEAGGKVYDVKPIPTEDPRHQQPPKERTLPRARILAAGVLVCVAALVMFYTYHSRNRTPVATAAPAAPPQPGATPTPLAAQEDDETSALRPTTLEILRGNTRSTLVVARSESTIGGVWEPDLIPGQAAHLDGTVVNIALCLAPQDQALVTSATQGETITLRVANGELRRYTAAAPRRVPRSEREVLDQRRIGLTLVVCGTAGNDRDILEATPQQLAPQAHTTAAAVATATQGR